jgi:hypothetical protein
VGVQGIYIWKNRTVDGRRFTQMEEQEPTKTNEEAFGGKGSPFFSYLRPFASIRG